MANNNNNDKGVVIFPYYIPDIDLRRTTNEQNVKVLEENEDIIFLAEETRLELEKKVYVHPCAYRDCLRFSYKKNNKYCGKHWSRERVRIKRQIIPSGKEKFTMQQLREAMCRAQLADCPYGKEANMRKELGNMQTTYFYRIKEGLRFLTYAQENKIIELIGEYFEPPFLKK